MATTSFAVGSVSVAIVWGTFFYPPPPERAGGQAAVTPAVVAPVAAQSAGVHLAERRAAAMPGTAVSRLDTPAALVLTASPGVAAQP